VGCGVNWIGDVDSVNWIGDVDSVNWIGDVSKRCREW
jgi:hypothetical protein